MQPIASLRSRKRCSRRGIVRRSCTESGRERWRVRAAREIRVMSRAERDIRRVVGAVRASISLVDVDLPDEFYPAHLSVALVDAVFRPRLGEGTVTVLERYCSRFGIPRLRARQWEMPPPDGQEPLRALVRHHEELGMAAMAREVYRASGHTGYGNVPRREKRFSTPPVLCGASGSKSSRTWRSTCPTRSSMSCGPGRE